MQNVSMQLPPPNVSGVSVPGNLVITNTPTNNYVKALERRHEAQRQLEMNNRKFSLQEQKPTPKPVKYFLGALAVVGAFFGGKAIFNHFKK